ncbi:DUF2062 domain-containing protein [Halalkalicoccus sp. NIPERK01]|uniref:DUF2062 domain-containing protein n=1 Tax=Halalkalicoccus sp. NIPERK01 TaxID=3053469 RepID=UPI00256EF20E|nr:DUF2062 domain-containing protein [Halalkalicoccus sp. NIPERK01]MDL5362288.1 DUF2062 domain-containing protein [Halalkalicoccus sp. NIPERK01]
MLRERLSAYRDAIRSELEAVSAEDHPPHDIAASFAVGVFITALPTLGTGLLLFVLIVALFDRVSKLALFASVVVLNPVAKWGVYATSFWLGTLLLGPVPGVSFSEVSFDAGPDIVARLLLGNLVLAVVLTVVGYVGVLRLVRLYRRRDVLVGDLLPERLSE